MGIERDACRVSPALELRAHNPIRWGIVHRRLWTQTSSIPFVVLRVAFGLLMFVSALRFLWNGWIDSFYVQPVFHFTYLGFGWVRPLPASGLYLVYGLLALLSLLIATGRWYRFSIIGFFLLFTYTELLDKTYYLNHYYFISSLSFLLIWLPKPTGNRTVPAWAIAALRLQLAIVYMYAGLAKLNPDWLFQAMPLKIWLAGHTDFPLLGPLFDHSWMAFAMSWAGALYDLTIPLFLLNRRTQPFAYVAVIGFHVMTGMLFPIGMFPAIMIACTLVFFDQEEFRWLLRRRKSVIPRRSGDGPEPIRYTGPPTGVPRTALTQSAIATILALFFCFQLAMPLRHWLYPGNLLWTEEGYRFAWHVMLAEKTGYVTFTARDANGREWTLYPRDYLTYQQEKQMSFQPDMILEFAHFLADEMRTAGRGNVAIYATAYVSLNGRPSQLLLDPTVDLVQQQHTLASKGWIMPLQE